MHAHNLGPILGCMGTSHNHVSIILNDSMFPMTLMAISPMFIINFLNSHIVNVLYGFFHLTFKVCRQLYTHS